MERKPIDQLSYGLFMLSTRDGEKKNGSIINTCFQAANEPARIAISVLNNSYTCELIKKSGVFALSILDSQCTFETIKHFGYQSGRDVDKFAQIPVPEDCNGVPYMGWHACGVISARVISSQNLDTHTLFVAQVVEEKRLSENEPLTYADYQNRVKPKPQAIQTDKKIVGWRCKICNFVYEGSQLPKDYICPLCGHGIDDFEPIYG